MAQHIKISKLTVESYSSYNIEVPHVKAIALKCDVCIIEGAYFISAGDTISVQEDPHEKGSALVLLPENVDNLEIYTGRIAGPIKIFFIDAGTISPKANPELRRKEPGCFNDPVSPDVWRKGLPAPSYTPGVTAVRHVVIHHSATSNIVTDPYETVRSIYTYHTQVNGWSDIGYNFLIAPNGTIFQGRDDLDRGDPDNIVGAHMCGVNSNTMGVCMLGTFTNVLPTEEAINSLAGLVKWKTEKENLPIFGAEVHAIGPPSANVPAQPLPNVCGHRDGCSPSYTECPGDLLYEQLNDVRELASDYACEQEEEEEINLAVYPNPTDAIVKVDFEWERLEIIDMRGSIIKKYVVSLQEISLRPLASGVYLFCFYTPEHGKLVKKVVKL